MGCIVIYKNTRPLVGLLIVYITILVGPPDRPLEYYLQTVFVGDLPDPVDQNELYRLYQQYGQIIEFKVIANRRFASHLFLLCCLISHV